MSLYLQPVFSSMLYLSFLPLHAEVFVDHCRIGFLMLCTQIKEKQRVGFYLALIYPGYSHTGIKLWHGISGIFHSLFVRSFVAFALHRAFKVQWHRSGWICCVTRHPRLKGEHTVSVRLSPVTKLLWFPLSSNVPDFKGRV